MRRNRYRTVRHLVAGLALTAAAVVCASAAAPFDWGLPANVTPPPVPADNPMTAAKVELGRQLFYDPDLSANRTLSCASCHEQARAFAVGDRTRPGVHGGPGRRNPMGLANVGYLTPLTWADPTARTLEGQVSTPLFGATPVEMGMKADGAELEQRLADSACYRRLFSSAFPGEAKPVSVANTSKALAAFQRTLLSWDAPYDRARRGDARAMSPEARAGERVFERAACTQCHGGPLFADGEFHQSVGPANGDDGAYEKTGREHERLYFRTPSLRNVALTGPYLRDGRAETLRDAILGHPADVGLAAGDLDALEAFLRSLTDETFITDARFAPPPEPCGRD